MKETEKRRDAGNQWLAEEGKSVLLATHDMVYAKRFPLG